MKKLSTANEIELAMKENLAPKADCPTTPDKIATALEHLSYAAQLFDTTGNQKYSDQVDELIAKLATELRK